MISGKNIPIIIVAYGNARDATECLEALRRSESDPPFDVYICENGGASAFDALVAALCAPAGPCAAGSVPDDMTYDTARFVRVQHLGMRGRAARVLIAEAKENFGYGGAINAWLGILLPHGDWPGAWILNPDTQPESRALAELVAWSEARGKGMVGSRIVPSTTSTFIHLRGLRWRLPYAGTEAVGYHAPAAIEPDPDELEARLDAPSGSSLYVTRACLQRIGLMDERYFLYYEDLDWGYRAKRSCGVGYAYKSIVPHHGGTTIRSGGRRSARSPLAVYLEFLNRIHFVRKYHPTWLAWTVFLLLIRPLEYGIAGAFANMTAAFRGVWMGIIGETGRPDDFIALYGRRNARRLSPAPSKRASEG